MKNLKVFLEVSLFFANKTNPFFFKPKIFLGEEKIKKVLGDSTKKSTMLNKAVASRKTFRKKSSTGSSTNGNRSRSRSRSESPRRYNKNRGSSSNSSRKRKSGNGGGGGKDSQDSKPKRSKKDSSKKKGIISSCISSWPTLLTSQAILLVTSLGFVMDFIPSLDNIPLGGRLSNFMENWRIVCKNKKNKWVLNVVEHGYRIPLKCLPFQDKYPVNPPATGNAYDVLVNEALMLKLKNAVKSVISCPGQWVSAYFAVPKPRKTDEFRPILNLKEFNLNVKKYKFSMETLMNIRDWIKPGAYCIGLDLRDAFLHIPISAESKKYLRFRWLDELLEWQVLPFGLTSSPRVITKVLKPVIAFLRSVWGILISIYIDDILIQHTSASTCSLHAQLVVLVFNCLGWGFKPEKCDIEPKQKFVHLGFVFNTSSMTISCTPEKVLRLQDFCSKLLAHGRCKVLSMEKLIGTIQSVSPAVPYADLFYRSLQGNRCKLTLPEPSCGSSPPSFEPSSSKVHLQSVLSYHLSGGTKSGYKCSYDKFVFLLSFSQCKSHHL